MIPGVPHRIMVSPQAPVLPILTSRTRFYGGNTHHPTLTIRQRYLPYPTRRDKLPGSLFRRALPSPLFLGSVSSHNQRSSLEPPSGDLPVEPSSPFPPTPQEESSPPSPRGLKPRIENDGLIPKPRGEPGRRKRGYNIDTVLGWQDSRLTELKVSKSSPMYRWMLIKMQEFVHKLADQHLNLKESFTKQRKPAVDAVTDAVS